MTSGMNKCGQHGECFHVSQCLSSSTVAKFDWHQFDLVQGTGGDQHFSHLVRFGSIGHQREQCFGHSVSIDAGLVLTLLNDTGLQSGRRQSSIRCSEAMEDRHSFNSGHYRGHRYRHLWHSWRRIDCTRLRIHFICLLRWNRSHRLAKLSVMASWFAGPSVANSFFVHFATFPIEVAVVHWWHSNGIDGFLLSIAVLVLSIQSQSLIWQKSNVARWGRRRSSGRSCRCGRRSLETLSLSVQLSLSGEGSPLICDCLSSRSLPVHCSTISVHRVTSRFGANFICLIRSPRCGVIIEVIIINRTARSYA